MTECLKKKLPDDWYENKALLSDEVHAHGGFVATSRAHPEVSDNLLRRRWAKFGLPEFVRPRVGVKLATDEELSVQTELEKTLLKAVEKLGDKATLVELADFCDVSPKRVRELLDHLSEAKGYRFKTTDGEQTHVELHRVPVESDNYHKAKALFDGDLVRFGVVSDVHLGSRHAMVEELHIAYEQLKIEGITTVYNPGDLVCGSGIYPGQVNDILFHTLEEQIDYAAKTYPKVDGIQTHFIGGNHDLEGNFGRIGANPVRAVCNQRDDLTYDGDYHAWYEFEQGTLMYVVHPKGGSGYARSYKLQKFAEAFEGGRKPNILIAGHYHDMMYLQDRNIQMLKAGCFESNGNLGVRVPLAAPATGFWIIEMRLAEDGSVVTFDPKWRPFYAGRTAV